MFLMPITQTRIMQSILENNDLSRISMGVIRNRIKL